MNKKEKEVIVNSVLSSLNKCSGVFVIDFKKINAFKVVAFKKDLFKTNSKIVVVKNSLLSLVAKKNDNLRKIESSFQQQIALIYSFDDVFKTASVVNSFLKDSKDINFKAGLINDFAISNEVFDKVSKVKSLGGLHSQLCGVLKNPIVNLISVLKQISEKNK